VSTCPRRQQPPPVRKRRRADAYRAFRRIDGFDAAVRNLHLAMAWPRRAETIALLLDADYVGHSIVVVDGAPTPDAVLDVTAWLATGPPGVPSAAAAVLCSVRPEGGLLPGDDDRWLTLDAVLAHVGIELLEWVVATEQDALLPRVLAESPPRWPAPGTT